MTYFYQSTRYGNITFTSYTGMTPAIIEQLMADLGHTDIQAITEDQYRTATQAQGGL